jgi:hypothetical protein
MVSIQNKRHFKLFALINTILLVLPIDVLASPQLSNSDCLIDSNLHTRKMIKGIRLVNKCQDCSSVVFEYRDKLHKKPVITGCYVPGQSRVFFPQVDDYRILEQFDCDENKIIGYKKSIKSELDKNYKSKRCEIYGVFAD